MKPLVIYHAHCTDGFGAAFAAWMKLGDDAEYVACSYGDGQFANPQDIREHVDGRDVYILDFSFPRPVMEQMLSDARRVVWLDHHKTAFEVWVGPTAIRYENRRDDGHYLLLDNNKSGAMLAWEYFHPGTEVPALIQRIDDRDRWVFKYDDSRALHAGLATLKPWTFDGWRVLLIGHMYERMVNDGQVILDVYNDQIKSRVRVAEKCAITAGEIYATAANTPSVAKGFELGGYIKGYEFDAVPGLAVNSPIHQSEIGNELAKASGTYGLVWYYDSATKRANVSLRSIGDYDVSAIAKAFGGGGHKNAAGFNIDVPTLLEWLK